MPHRFEPKVPKELIRHRTKVYKFGVLWFWKCQEPRSLCGVGARSRKWPDAIEKAYRHTRQGCYSPSHFCVYCGEFIVETAGGVWEAPVDETSEGRRACDRSKEHGTHQAWEW